MYLKLRILSLSNYDPIVQSVTESLNRWISMPISMLGHINIIKMSILPKFLYLFQSVPLQLSQAFFSKLRNLFSNFIWNNRRPRLRLSLLYLPYDRGGLQIPNLQWYYWAAQLRSAMFYFSPSDPPAWLAIECTATSGLPLQSCLYSANIRKLKKQTKKPFAKNTLSVWHEAHAYIGDAPKLSQFSSIWGHDNFVPIRADGGFIQWVGKGLSKVTDLYVGGKLITFDQLIDKYDIPRKHQFKYLQLKSFIASQTHNLEEPSMSAIERTTVNCKDGRGQLSVIYVMLRSKSKDSSHSRLNTWRDDLEVDIRVN